jgi:hypothetical protein
MKKIAACMMQCERSGGMEDSHGEDEAEQRED